MIGLFYYIGAIIMVGSAALILLPTPQEVVDEKNTRLFLAFFIIGAIIFFCTWMFDV